MGRGESPSHNKKADLVEHPKAFDQIGLLVDGPPGLAGLPFAQSSDDFAPAVDTSRITGFIMPTDGTILGSETAKASGQSAEPTTRPLPHGMPGEVRRMRGGR
jgi:hypothetical protein